MNAYNNCHESEANLFGKNDPITLDELEILKPSSHPRGSIAVRLDNGKGDGIIYYYNVQTLINIINNDCRDPFTRQLLDEITVKRAKLYYKLIQNFPYMTKEEINYEQIYTDWVNDPTNQLNLLKAKCFLQPSDILEFFRRYGGKGSVTNREQAEAELRNKPKNSWLLRNSSVKDTNTRKGYTLSVKTNHNTIEHVLIVHKLGSGIYFGVALAREAEIPEKLIYTEVYPSIVDLLMEYTF